MYSNHPPLASAWWPSTAQNRILRTVLLAVAGSLLLTFSAKFKVPYWPVPVTMQTFVVLSLGMIYGWRHAAAASKHRKPDSTLSQIQQHGGGSMTPAINHPQR